MSATTPDQIADAFIAVLTPNGVPVGNIGAIVQWTPDTPYQGPLPIVQIRPAQNGHTRVAAAGTKMDVGWVEITYRDATLEQQQSSVPSTTLTQIEKAAVAARNVIISTLDADHKLSGAVSDAASDVQEVYNPDGFYTVWQGAEWIGWSSRANYRGPKQ